MNNPKSNVKCHRIDLEDLLTQLRPTTGSFLNGLDLYYGTNTLTLLGMVDLCPDKEAVIGSIDYKIFNGVI